MHPRVLAQLGVALRKFGLNVSASRLTTGNHLIYERLERALAEFFDAPAATLTANGYLPSFIVAQTLAGRFSHVVIDERAHACLQEAAQMLGCQVATFRHREPMHLGQVLKRLGVSKPLLMTDGMFSRDGSVAPLKDYLALLPAKGMMLVDDAHAAGVLGATGKGSLEECGIRCGRIIQTITLSKAFGTFGGAVLGSEGLRKSILMHSKMFASHTPTPLPLAAAALEAIQLLEQDASFRQRLKANNRLFKQALLEGGFTCENHPGPILPVLPSTPGSAAALKRQLLRAGIHPPFIHYPGGPASGFFRFVLSSEHSSAQIRQLAGILVRWQMKSGA